MFTAIGAAVQRNGAAYDIVVDYFDDRVVPMKLVSQVLHNVTTKQELQVEIQAQLTAMKSADLLDSLNAQIVGKVLATI